MDLISEFGLTSQDYERGSNVGFGSYRNETNGGELMTTQAMSQETRARLFTTEAKRSPLPFIFKKAPC
jgi:hypothetical protein